MEIDEVMIGHIPDILKMK